MPSFVFWKYPSARRNPDEDILKMINSFLPLFFVFSLLLLGHCGSANLDHRCPGIQCFVKVGVGQRLLDCLKIDHIGGLPSNSSKDETITCSWSASTGKVYLSTEMQRRIFVDRFATGTLRRLAKSIGRWKVTRLSVSFILVRSVSRADFNGIGPLSDVSMWNPDYLAINTFDGVENMQRFSLKLHCEKRNQELPFKNLLFRTKTWRLSTTYCPIDVLCSKVDCDYRGKNISANLLTAQKTAGIPPNELVLSYQECRPPVKCLPRTLQEFNSSVPKHSKFPKWLRNSTPNPEVSSSEATDSPPEQQPPTQHYEIPHKKSRPLDPIDVYLEPQDRWYHPWTNDTLLKILACVTLLNSILLTIVLVVLGCMFAKRRRKHTFVLKSEETSLLTTRAL